MGALRAIGAILARRGNVGDADSDEFAIATIFGGTERASRATSLRRGRVVACFGGVELDLRQATLDPGGAQLLLRAYLGGVQVLVPADWRVVVTSEAKAGGVDTHVTPETDLADDAPSLHVEVRGVLGGVQVTTENKDEDEHAPGSGTAPPED